ncbi:MAG TPA: hypothetical protein VLE70_20525 [Anaerolineae bacterium]|nr:hypothetical protein [Anaerolineae bacterium]
MSQAAHTDQPVAALSLDAGRGRVGDWHPWLGGYQPDDLLLISGRALEGGWHDAILYLPILIRP